MLSSILLASDGSEASDRIIECAKELAQMGVRQVTLTHVFHVRDVGGLYEQLRRSMLTRLETQRRILEDAGLQVTIETPLGLPFVEIERLAAERQAAAIVVGSLGASLVGDALLGSTAYGVLRTATRPVLLIRVEITDGGEAGRKCRVACGDFSRHVLFPTDFSDTADRALSYLEHLVRETQAEVTLLHVQDQAKIEGHLRHKLEEFNRIDAERLERMKLRLEQSHPRAVHVDVPYGSPTAVILERARSHEFSLILMGSQGRGFIHEVFLGSVANNVARHAPLPVLFVPAVR